jgi:hypothetical protein
MAVPALPIEKISGCVEDEIPGEKRGIQGVGEQEEGEEGLGHQ